MHISEWAGGGSVVLHVASRSSYSECPLEAVLPLASASSITNTRGVLGALFLLWKEVGEEPLTEGSPGLPGGSRGRGHTVGAKWGEDLPALGPSHGICARELPAQDGR